MQRLVVSLGLALFALTLTGCVSSPFGAMRAPNNQGIVLRAPKGYVPLRVPNACFVESVNFYDFYEQNRLGGNETWVRVLQWGDLKDEYTVKPGHAVAVFTAGGKVWIYDVNYGFVDAKVPVPRRGLPHEVGPAIFPRYPQFQPVLLRYNEERLHQLTHTGPQYSPKTARGDGDLKAVLAAAEVLQRRRLVRVVQFTVTENGRNRTREATLFPFGAHLCIYLPDRGTVILPAALSSVDNLPTVRLYINNLFPTAKDLRYYEPKS